jgi:hypothetical protein
MANPFQFAGTTVRPRPPVPRALVVLSFLPLVLVPIGGLLGGLIGGTTAAINVLVARGHLGGPAKVAVILGLSVAAVLLYAGVLFAALAVPSTSVPPLQVGTCVNGIHPGAAVTAEITKPVDCTTGHDDEIVGVVAYTTAGAYPGQAAVDTFANGPCVAAFSSYVGIDFELSSLDMITVTPSELTWARGDRQISCVAVARDGVPLTGSVKDSRR